MSILMTGGSGLLGTELLKYIKCDAPSHEEMDITNPNTFPRWKNYDTIIHCAAYTDVAKAETDAFNCFNVNMMGTYNLVKHFPYSRFVYISTEYVYEPVNVYTQSKLAGERVVKKNPNHLIIRTLFKPRPFPHPKAFTDQFTTGDYVDVIAPIMIPEIKECEFKIFNIGTGRKSIYELAKQSNPKVGKMSIKDITNVKLPHDTCPKA
jgi:dTDP-4-dehydrorhamnose reductase